MNVHFRQTYCVPDVYFPFSHLFQHRISEEVEALVEPSVKFVKKYGEDFDLIFNVSAKPGLSENEIRGPAVYRKTKDVEFTIFLPYDVIMRHADAPRHALRFLLKDVGEVFDKLEIEKTRFVEQQESIIEGICSDPTMLAAPHWSGVVDPTWTVFKAFFDKNTRSGD